MKRTFNRVRTDLLETRMSHYLATHEVEKYEAIRDLAVNIGAPIDLHLVITEAIERRKAYYGDDIDITNLVRMGQDEE